MANKPDVRVRLSAEGVQEVVGALKRIANEADRTGKQANVGMNVIGRGADFARGRIVALGGALGLLSFGALGKQAIDFADNTGKAAARIGASAENFSALSAAARTADVDNSALEATLARTARSVDELRQGSDKAVDSFAQLGLKAEDFVGLDTVQAFNLISQRLGAVEGGTRKSAAAMDILGKSGTAVIPLMNDLAEQGFDKVKQSAEDMGLIVTDETAMLAAQVNDDFTIIKGQVQGLALQFVSGLLPSVQEVMAGFKEETSGRGVKSMQQFGQDAGRILRTVIATFKLFYDAASQIFTSLGRTLGGFGALLAALFKGDFREAANIWKMMGEDDDREFGNFLDDFKRNLAKVAEEANKEVIPVNIEPRVVNMPKLIDAETSAERKAREKSLREAEREAERLARERQERERKAAEELIDMRIQELELSGKGREAQLMALEIELNKRREILSAAGQLNENTNALLANVERLSKLKINFEDLQAQVELQLQTYQRMRDQIQAQVEAGVITEFQARKQMIELEQSRIPILQRITQELLRQAELSGDPKLIEAAQAYRDQVNQISIDLDRANDANTRLREGALDAFEQGTSRILQNLEEFSSVEDVFKSLARTVADSLRQIVADMIAAAIRAQIVKAVFGAMGGGAAAKDGGQIQSLASGGAVDARGGGFLLGPGTTTSDSILARVSKKEFVVRAKVVEKPGVLPLLNMLNSGRIDARALRAMIAPVMMNGYKRFAGGGQVSGATTGNAVASNSSPKFRIVNVVDPEVTTDAMASAAGERVVMNHIEKNSSKLGRMFGGR